MTHRTAATKPGHLPPFVSIIGPPGSGKTTALQNLIDRLQTKHGLEDRDVCFVTFRRSMASEILNRRFPGMETSEVREIAPYWGTLHGICRRLLCTSGEKVANSKVWTEFCRKEHIPFEEENRDDELYRWSRSPGAVLGNVKAFLTHNQIPTSMWWRAPGAEELVGLAVPDLISKWEEFKETYSELHPLPWDPYAGDMEVAWLDFDDLLGLVNEQGCSPPCPVMVADEYQDMTPLMHRIFQNWAQQKGVIAVAIAGDPAQNIYSFFGSDPTFFEEACARGEVIPLTRSWRLPAEIWDYAKTIIPGQTPESMECVESGGFVRDMHFSDLACLLDPYRGDDMTFLLRTNHLAVKLGYLLREAGIPFTGAAGWSGEAIALYNTAVVLRAGQMPPPEAWRVVLEHLPSSCFNYSKKEVLAKVSGRSAGLKAPDPQKRLGDLSPSHFIAGHTLTRLRTGGELPWKKHPRILNRALALSRDITSPGRVRVSTIHAAKGTESDIVFLFDAITRRVQRSVMTQKGSREEARVFYVGATRARRGLFIVRGFGSLSYPLPLVAFGHH